MRRDHILGALLGSCSVSGVVCMVASVLPLGSGLICSATTIKRFIDVPGGSHVIRVMVFSLLDGPRTDTSVGGTIFFSYTL